ncbi:5-bromo-4-chloroindolyl phosphate hydrolysis family protein [Lentibacter algarum]|uniref:5-bromo-4-chloroindolyl phosphate hydrolysis family protein n=1 Tax=Lentibacter algarum TaxID=576131 RepID=UPI001C06EDBA|nr:5-bromo-4-chloroindolyl phosphate hydrolysis family protein [Lentibacter algarum]MBU2980800.1 5-bromo-4-chloroindolyl phosphate hydrolysis family protein [Lentibacter algarum]
MAQRYGGKHSPETGDSSYRGARRTRAGGRVNLLFLAPLPMVWQAFTSPPAEMFMWLVALGSMLLAAWLTRDGLIAQEAYDARKVARRPAVPRKILGSLLTGAGLAVAGYVGFGLGSAVIFAVLGAVLHFAAFGADPLKNKGMDGVDEFQTDRVARAVEKAEEHLKAMTSAAHRAGDRQVEARVESFQMQVRELLRTVEEDPRDLTGARKFMGVYLKGARDACEKFADVYTRAQSPDAKADFMTLLSDLQASFDAKTKHLLLDNHSDLTVEIEVLRDRLKQEGIRLDQS